jgi:hypothetical protein
VVLVVIVNRRLTIAWPNASGNFFFQNDVRIDLSRQSTRRPEPADQRDGDRAVADNDLIEITIR